MRSVCQSLNLLTTSVGFMMGGAVTSLFESWIPTDLSEKGAHLEYMFFFLAATCCGAIALIWYLLHTGYGGKGFVPRARRLENQGTLV